MSKKSNKFRLKKEKRNKKFKILEIYSFKFKKSMLEHLMLPSAISSHQNYFELVIKN